MLQIYNLFKSNLKKGSFKSLEFLVTDICTIINSDPNKILSDLNDLKVIAWNEKYYNKKRINSVTTADFDMYVNSWLPNQKTAIQDHPQHGRLICLIDGTLEEKIYNKKLELIEKKIIKGPCIRYIDNSIGYQTIQCVKKAVSLEIYSPGRFRPFLMAVIEEKK